MYTAAASSIVWSAIVLNLNCLGFLHACHSDMSFERELGTVFGQSPGNQVVRLLLSAPNLFKCFNVCVHNTLDNTISMRLCACVCMYLYSLLAIAL